MRDGEEVLSSQADEQPRGISRCARNDGVQDGAEGQARFYDFNGWSRKKLKEKLDFFTRDLEAVNMHANPVIRGLVKHPRDWRWSSWGFYVNGESGLVKIDRMD